MKLLVRSTVAPVPANRDACSVLMLAQQALLTTRSLPKLMHFTYALGAHRAAWNVHQIGVNPAAALQIGGRNNAPSAANFLAVSMQEIGVFSAKPEIGVLGGKGRIFGGQD
ncbi:hypothetical protein WMC41_14370 [Shinella yambaruensis]|uniref:hypothetical protein n=1 Tax=Shinella yambaruensis TaxID=415996 RepID=UPI003D78E2F1